MKLSNKILIGFFGFILLYMLAAFTEIRLKGDLNRLVESKSKVESVPIQQDVNYLVLPDIHQRIIIASSDESRVELRSISGDVAQKLSYKIMGDTLVLERLEVGENERVNLYFYLGENELRGIEVNESSVIIRDLNQPALSIIQTGGWVRMEENNEIDKIHIQASGEADLNASGFEVDTLSLQLDDARIMFWSRVNRLEGSMINDSYLQVSGPGDLQFKKDETSRLQLVN